MAFKVLDAPGIRVAGTLIVKLSIVPGLMGGVNMAAFSIDVSKVSFVNMRHVPALMFFGMNKLLILLGIIIVDGCIKNIYKGGVLGFNGG